MLFQIFILIFTPALFAGILLMLELGRRYGVKKRIANPHGFDKGVGTVDGAIFGLLGLLIAFTFSGAASRFENRKHLITIEANAIGTAYLRIDLLPATVQPEMREMFRKYLEKRISTYSHGVDTALAWKEFKESVVIQNKIWKHAITNCQNENSTDDACKLLLPSINEMIDIATTRMMVAKEHPPLIIFILMGILCLLGGLLAGYGMSGSKARNILLMVVFAAVMSFTIFVILDLEYPRVGFIRLSDADQVLLELLSEMK